MSGKSKKNKRKENKLKPYQLAQAKRKAEKVR